MSLYKKACVIYLQTTPRAKLKPDSTYDLVHFMRKTRNTIAKWLHTFYMLQKLYEKVVTVRSDLSQSITLLLIFNIHLLLV